MDGRVYVAAAESDEDLDALAALWRSVDHWSAPTPAAARHNLATWPFARYMLARVDGGLAGAGFTGVYPGTERESFAVLVTASPSGSARVEVLAALASAASTAVRALEKTELTTIVSEDDPESLAFFVARGFVEEEREQLVELDLDRFDADGVTGEPPPGVEIVTLAERPDLEQAMYVLHRDVLPDMPGNDERIDQSFEQWREREVAHPDRSPQLCFLAIGDGELVGWAAISTRGAHGLTCVRRDRRRQGIATALKLAEIAAANERGLHRLRTGSEERNTPMRALNARLGYEPVSGEVFLRGPLFE